MKATIRAMNSNWSDCRHLIQNHNTHIENSDTTIICARLRFTQWHCWGLKSSGLLHFAFLELWRWRHHVPSGHQETRTRWNNFTFLKIDFQLLTPQGTFISELFTSILNYLSFSAATHLLYWSWPMSLPYVIRATSNLYLVAIHQAFGSWSMTCCRGIQYSDLQQQRSLILGYRSCWTHWEKKEDNVFWTTLDPCPI